MTITLELWQTVVLTALILSLVVILRRLATLIVMGDNLNWYRQNDERTSPSEQNLLSTGSYESRSDGWEMPVPSTYDEAHFRKALSMGSTGIQTGGVSYIETPAEKRSKRKGKRHF